MLCLIILLIRALLSPLKALAATMAQAASTAIITFPVISCEWIERRSKLPSDHEDRAELFRGSRRNIGCQSF
jgi:hypothetical protein